MVVGSFVCFVVDIVADANNFEELVRRLTPVCQAVHSHVMALSMEEIKCIYLERLQWTGMTEVRNTIQTKRNPSYSYSSYPL